MAATALSYTYRYAGASEVETVPGSSRLRLATQVLDSAPKLFLRGRLVCPKRSGELLLGLMEVLDARFHIPGAMLSRVLRLADPVVTCGTERLRFEAFSQCCGAYARVDLLDEAVDGELINPGTTNVDFNSPMRAGLARLTDSGPALLTVGADRVELESSRAQVVERKVSYPSGGCGVLSKSRPSRRGCGLRSPQAEPRFAVCCRNSAVQRELRSSCRRAR